LAIKSSRVLCPCSRSSFCTRPSAFAIVQQRAGAEALEIQVEWSDADVVEVIHVEAQLAALALVDTEVLEVQIADDEALGGGRLGPRHAVLQEVPAHQVEGAAEELEGRRRQRPDLAPQRLPRQVLSVAFPRHLVLQKGLVVGDDLGERVAAHGSYLSQNLFGDLDRRCAAC
jgi:hypothetical protein